MVKVNRPLTKFHLTDADRPLTDVGWETTSELIDHYLLVLMHD